MTAKILFINMATNNKIFFPSRVNPVPLQNLSDYIEISSREWDNRHKYCHQNSPNCARTAGLAGPCPTIYKCQYYAQTLDVLRQFRSQDYAYILISDQNLLLPLRNSVSNFGKVGSGNTLLLAHHQALCLIQDV